MHIVTGEATRKTLLDREPNLDKKSLTLDELITECSNAYQKKTNLLMDL